MYMETKGIEEMTREELIELVSSLNKDLESTKKDLELYKDWNNTWKKHILMELWIWMKL